jgi:hypothetical protein
MDNQTEELFKKMAEQFIKLIESNNFLLQENLRLMKINTTYPTNTTYTTNITSGQKNYISRLKMEGKIPQSQTLDISKDEAQVLIHNALNPNKSEGKEQTTTQQVQTGSDTLMSKEEQDLFKEVEDY